MSPVLPGPTAAWAIVLSARPQRNPFAQLRTRCAGRLARSKFVRSSQVIPPGGGARLCPLLRSQSGESRHGANIAQCLPLRHCRPTSRFRVPRRRPWHQQPNRSDVTLEIISESQLRTCSQFYSDWRANNFLRALSFSVLTSSVLPCELFMEAIWKRRLARSRKFPTNKSSELSDRRNAFSLDFTAAANVRCFAISSANFSSRPAVYRTRYVRSYNAK